MPMNSKKTRILVTVVFLILMGGSGFLCLHLNGAKNRMAAERDQAESRNRLLDQKYKEEKALVGRLQRENLTLSGQARQARMDMAKFEAEAVQLREERARMENQHHACDEAKAKLSERIDQLNLANDQLHQKLNDTATRLKTVEIAEAAVEERNQALNADLSQVRSANKRYLAHNRRLCEIAQTLVARVEKEELGSSVLVKEPLIQWKRVELENLLQGYLDKIDENKIVN